MTLGWVLCTTHSVSTHHTHAHTRVCTLQLSAHDGVTRSMKCHHRLPDYQVADSHLIRSLIMWPHTHTSITHSVQCSVCQGSGPDTNCSSSLRAPHAAPLSHMCSTVCSAQCSTQSSAHTTHDGATLRMQRHPQIPDCQVNGFTLGPVSDHVAPHTHLRHTHRPV